LSLVPFLGQAKLLGLVNVGLSPFLYWHNRMPRESFFTAAVFMLVLSAVLCLFNLNVVLKRLAAMLPDKTLCHETFPFTALNRRLLVLLLLLDVAYMLSLHVSQTPLAFGIPVIWLNRLGLWLLTFFALLPLAMTIVLISKTKETILDSVFGAKLMETSNFQHPTLKNQ
jgi:hypothetical protein